MPLRRDWEELSRRQEALIKKLEQEGIIKSEIVKKTMLKVPRHLFVPPHLVKYAYDDSPLPIGHGQTISAPHMVAMMTELLELEEGQKILEIGTGSGYQAAILAEIVGEKGLVVSVEYVPELAKNAYRILKSLGYNNVLVVIFDGSLGFPILKPYDRIIVTCASPRFPEHLIKQLKPEGIMVAPVGSSFYQKLYVYKGGKIKDYGFVAFVPMRGKKGFYP